MHATNVKQAYDVDDEIRVRLFGRDLLSEQEGASKVPITRKTVVFEDVFYRVVDVDSNEKMFEFGESDNSTRVSTDSEGMFFDFHVDVLPRGRSYSFEYLILNRGSREIVQDKNVVFRVL